VKLEGKDAFDLKLEVKPKCQKYRARVRFSLMINFMVMVVAVVVTVVWNRSGGGMQ
jgi:hypothetical protein